MENPYTPPQSPSAPASPAPKSRLARRGLHAIRWYLAAVLPGLVFCILAFVHVYRAEHLDPATSNLLLSREEIYGSADILFLSGIILSGCLLAMVALNDAVSLIGRLFNKLTRSSAPDRR